MRIAFVCTDRGVPIFGSKGCSIHVQEVVRAMARTGARVQVFAGRRPEEETPPGLEDITVCALPLLPKGELASREQSALGQNPILRERLERDGPFDLIYERYALWSYAAMEYARDQGIPGVLEVNAPLIEEQARYRGLVDREEALAATRRAFRAASALVAVSHEIAAYLRQFVGAAGRVHVIPNGVNLDRFQPGVPPSLPASPGQFTVGFVGSLKPWHGLPTLIRAFRLLQDRFSNVRLLIVGDGPERTQVERLLEEHGVLKHTQMTGKVPSWDVPGLLTSMDVAAAPYHGLADFYFSPLKVYEYLASGVPVVTSRIGQLATLIRDNQTGLLCRPDDPEELASALERLHKDPELCSRLGQQGRAQVLSNHSWQSVVDRILKLVTVGKRREDMTAAHRAMAVQPGNEAGTFCHEKTS
jgi:glycosyltransferase involved in cell wall biosynthesis